MSRLIAAEFIKLRTTRLGWILVGIWAILSATIAAAIVGFTSLDDLSTVADQDTMLRMAWSFLGVLLLPVLGVSIATADTHHRTLGITLLNEPRRLRVVLAKALTALGAGAGAGALTGLACLLIGAGVLAGRGAESGLVGGLGLSSIAAAALYGGLVCLFGFAVGMLINNQTAAIVITVAFFLVIEGVLSLLLLVASEGLGVDSLGEVVAWLPGTTSSQTALLGAEGVDLEADFGDVSLLSPLASAAVLTAWGFVLSALGALRLDRADVT